LLTSFAQKFEASSSVPNHPSVTYVACLHEHAYRQTTSPITTPWAAIPYHDNRPPSNLALVAAHSHHPKARADIWLREGPCRTPFDPPTVPTVGDVAIPLRLTAALDTLFWAQILLCTPVCLVEASDTPPWRASGLPDKEKTSHLREKKGISACPLCSEFRSSRSHTNPTRSCLCTALPMIPCT